MDSCDSNSFRQQCGHEDALHGTGVPSLQVHLQRKHVTLPTTLQRLSHTCGTAMQTSPGSNLDLQHNGGYPASWPMDPVFDNATAVQKGF